MRTHAIAATVVLALAASGCSETDPRLSTARSVVFVGDSIAEETAPFLGPLLDGRTLVAKVLGGTAPCDWLGSDLQISDDSVVVFSFTGNSLTPCMQDEAGGQLKGQAQFDKYRADLELLIEQSLEVGIGVVLVGQAVHSDFWPTELVKGVNALYRDLANRVGVVFVDAGAAIENPDGSYAHELPCLADEPECGVSGSNVVRTDDGVHLCPGELVFGPCLGYSSGAFRFAKAIAEAIVES